MEDFTPLNNLIAKTNYTASTKDKIINLMCKNEDLLTKGKSPHIMLGEVRKKLIKKPKGKDYEVVVWP